MNFPHNKNYVLLMMSLKLTIKVVAFFLGHPVLQKRVVGYEFHPTSIIGNVYNLAIL